MSPKSCITVASFDGRRGVPRIARVGALALPSPQAHAQADGDSEAESLTVSPVPDLIGLASSPWPPRGARNTPSSPSTRKVARSGAGGRSLPMDYPPSPSPSLCPSPSPSPSPSPPPRHAGHQLAAVVAAGFLQNERADSGVAAVGDADWRVPSLQHDGGGGGAAVSPELVAGGKSPNPSGAFDARHRDVFGPEDFASAEDFLSALMSRRAGKPVAESRSPQLPPTSPLPPSPLPEQLPQDWANLFPAAADASSVRCRGAEDAMDDAAAVVQVGDGASASTTSDQHGKLEVQPQHPADGHSAAAITQPPEVVDHIQAGFDLAKRRARERREREKAAAAAKVEEAQLRKERLKQLRETAQAVAKKPAACKGVAPTRASRTGSHANHVSGSRRRAQRNQPRSAKPRSAWRQQPLNSPQLSSSPTSCTSESPAFRQSTRRRRRAHRRSATPLAEAESAISISISISSDSSSSDSDSSSSSASASASSSASASGKRRTGSLGTSSSSADEELSFSGRRRPSRRRHRHQHRQRGTDHRRHRDGSVHHDKRHTSRSRTSMRRSGYHSDGADGAAAAQRRLAQRRAAAAKRMAAAEAAAAAKDRQRMAREQEVVKEAQLRAKQRAKAAALALEAEKRRQAIDAARRRAEQFAERDKRLEEFKERQSKPVGDTAAGVKAKGTGAPRRKPQKPVAADQEKPSACDDNAVDHVHKPPSPTVVRQRLGLLRRRVKPRAGSRRGGNPAVPDSPSTVLQHTTKHNRGTGAAAVDAPAKRAQRGVDNDAVSVVPPALNMSADSISAPAFVVGMGTPSRRGLARVPSSPFQGRAAAAVCGTPGTAAGTTPQPQAQPPAVMAVAAASKKAPAANPHAPGPAPGLEAFLNTVCPEDSLEV